MGALLHFVSRMVEVPQNMFGISGGSSFVFGIAGKCIFSIIFMGMLRVEGLFIHLVFWVWVRQFST